MRERGRERGRQREVWGGKEWREEERDSGRKRGKKGENDDVVD